MEADQAQIQDKAANLSTPSNNWGNNWSYIALKMHFFASSLGQTYTDQSKAKAIIERINEMVERE